MQQFDGTKTLCMNYECGTDLYARKHNDSRYGGKHLLRKKFALFIGCAALAMSSGCGGGGGGGTAPAALPAITVTKVSVVEGNAGTTNLVFTVAASVAAPRAIKVNYATADGTALAASDYTAAAATLTIPAGLVMGTITVLINADKIYEANETLTLTLSNPVNATIARATATGTILNDDAIGLNDTGITQWGNGSVNNLTVTQPLFPVQDADVGRDANPALNSNTDGKAGFSFTKLDAAGQPLTDQAATYAITPWNCVLDQVTGLMWEVKTTAGFGGLRDASYTYSWFNSSGVNDGGNAGTPNGGVCLDTVNCDTEKYVAAVNAVGLCGLTGWRLPRIGELYSIMDHGAGISGPASIDAGYFPNTVVSMTYWSSSPYAGFANVAWGASFINGGGDGLSRKSTNGNIRLVRGGQ